MKAIWSLIAMGIILAHPGAAVAQTEDTLFIKNDMPDGYNQKKRLFAYYSINELRKGALLVMLHTRSKAIHLYYANKATEIANRIRDEQATENHSIVAAFNKEYNFSKVYFFYDDCIDSVLSGKRSGFFLDSNLIVDPTIKMEEPFFMEADYGPIEEESFEFAQEGGHATGTETSSGRCLILRDSYFVQMRPPFPFYVSAGNVKNAERQVAELNNSLKRFYAKHFSSSPEYPFQKSKFFDPVPDVKP